LGGVHDPWPKVPEQPEIDRNYDALYPGHERIVVGQELQLHQQQENQGPKDDRDPDDRRKQPAKKAST
jgi:hypothetical protein